MKNPLGERLRTMDRQLKRATEKHAGPLSLGGVRGKGAKQAAKTGQKRNPTKRG